MGGKRGRKTSILGVVLVPLAVLVVIGCVWRVCEIDPSEGFFAATDVAST